MTPEEVVIRRAMARLRAGIMAIVFGMLGGTSLFGVTAWLLIRGEVRAGHFLGLLAHYFPGFRVTWSGAFLGFFYGAATGAVIGGVLALLYNAVERRVPGARARLLVGILVGGTFAMSCEKAVGCQAPEDGRPVYVVSGHSGHCLEVARYAVQSGPVVDQGLCAEGAHQRWKLLEVAPGLHEIRNVHSRKCLDVDPGGPANGSVARQSECTGEPRQHWRIAPGELGACRLVHVQSGKCLEVLNYSMVEDAPVGVWDCHKGSNQGWELR